jgi:SAM-dependent methyltransferase
MKLCKVYSLNDARETDPLWQELLLELCPDWKTNGAIHRKHWEWGLGLYGLHKLGCITPEAQALSVGAGVEWPLYYLANRVQRVYATDLYSQDSHFHDLDPTVPGNAQRLAPFPYKHDALVFEKMDALDLRFADNTFDFVFTFSSIEHFGGHNGAALAMQEIARVLKPNGVAVISTEIILAGPPHPEFFQTHEIEPCFVQSSGLELVEPLDLSIDEELIANPVDFNVPEGFTGYTGPHTSVRCGDLTFTSIEFLLRKPLNWQPASPASQMRLKAGLQSWHGKQKARQAVPPLVRRVLKKAVRLATGRQSAAKP